LAFLDLRKIWQSPQTSPDPAKSIHRDFVEIKSNPEIYAAIPE